MSEDDWSLKGKEHSDYTVGKTHIGLDPKKPRFAYYEEDIETLRQKLIEDLAREFAGWYSEYYWTLKESENEARKDISRIINKRFGVEE